MIKSILKSIVYNRSLRSFGKRIFRCFPSLAVTYSYMWDGRVVRRKAKQLLKSGVNLPEKATREDYFSMFRSHKMSLNEYLHIYRIYEKTQEEREEFVSKLQMNALSLKLRMMFPEYDNKPLLNDKEKFLSYLTSLDLCHRRWLYAPNATFEEFADMVGAVDCIMKPHDSSCGYGIFKVTKQDDPQVKSLYERCVTDRILVEECIQGCEAIQAFHPSSLNTIRLITVGYEGKAQLLGAIIRMGQGKTVVDNSAVGGFYAGIDIETGIVNSDGVTVTGDTATVHPDTNLAIKGFQVPYWNELVQHVLDTARKTKNIITGWDVAITQEGGFEFVEANYQPDPEGMQSPLQQGMRSRLLKMISEVTGRQITL